ncbi:HNH endonuclease [Paenibacillus xylanexedens]|uniref:HNH endonuclease n=1 Tax=Paenibacillus xylanexedens TaxID=528191 RepID=UPI0021B6E452|nr:HNH endonuclease [Paenibacillus xylanexedens]
MELVEEVNGKSEKVLLEAEIHRSFEMIESAFDQALASMGEAELKQERLARNWELRHQSELNRNIDEGKSLLRMVGDVADILYTGLEGPDQVRATYSSFKDGGYVGPLEERNATWQGLVKTWDYASDVVTLQKSWGELGNDALGVASEFITPLMNQAKKDPITMLTFTEEESKQAGVSDAEANLAQLDIAGMALGGSSLVKKSAMKINKLGRKSDHGDGSGTKGFLHGDGDGPDSTSAVLKDGKFKTNAALLPPSLNELGELIAKAVGKMTEGAAASIPWRIRYVQLPDGGNVPVIMKMDKQGSSGNRKEDFKGGTEGTGKKTGKLDLSDFTKEIMETKPMNLPVPKRWYDKGGTISIDENGTWTYTNKKGQSVSYPDGYPDFSEYYHPTVEPVEIKFASPTNRPADYKAANLEAGLSKDSVPPVTQSNKSPTGYTWHHHQDGKTMILVDEKVHAEFRHIGGVSKVNGKGNE